MLSKTSSVKIKKSPKKKSDGNIPKELIYEVALELMLSLIHISEPTRPY